MTKQICYYFYKVKLYFLVVSNEVPEHPCVSPLSNCVFERRLIEKYIAENGVDPMTNEVLSEEQLIDIKGSNFETRLYLVCKHH